MSAIAFRSIPMNRVPEAASEPSTPWLWHGYLAPGNITLFTSFWKAGKTTLLTGLLRQMHQSDPFLGRSLNAAHGLVVSEETIDLWAPRLRLMPVGPHVELLARPFSHRPTLDDWNALIDDAVQRRRDGRLDLFVVDTIAKFAPGPWETNPLSLMEALEPLHRLTNLGASVLLLHHPRKQKSEPGHSARGTGALLGFVDIALELSHLGRMRADDHRRQVIALSRHRETPARLVYEWEPQTGVFNLIDDPHRVQFERNWCLLLSILQKRTAAATHRELLDDWPSDQSPPSASVLYEWLNRAFDEKRLRREGKGTKISPWRYRLENEDDKYYDRGELPPLKDLPWRLG